MKPQLRRPSRGAHDLDIAPEHALRMPGAERFHRRFFGGKPASEMGRRIAAARGVGDFPVGEDAAQESITVSRNRGFDAIDFGRIHTDTDNIDGHG